MTAREDAGVAPGAVPGVGGGGLMLSLAVLALLLAAVGLAVGPAGPAPLAAVRDLLRGEPDVMAVILLELRLPRLLLALLVGAALGMAGAAMQAYLRNPLAEPGVLGVSSCAAFGAVVAFYGGFAALSILALPVGGILGALAGAVLVSLLAGRGAGVATLILVGVAVNALAAALTALVLSLTSNPFAFYEAAMWLMGSVADRALSHVLMTIPFVVAGAALLLAARPGLDALVLGEEAARGLGVDIARLGRLVLAGTALAVGAAVAASGVVGFVGLMAPHVVRAAVGHRPGATLLPSALAGIVLVLAADIVVRLVPTGRELQLGVLTALIGAPFLLGLAIRRAGRDMWG
jgi:iron complex transport system permease protein